MREEEVFIVRLECKNKPYKAYQVRWDVRSIPYLKSKTYKSKAFCDNVHCGKESALEAAIDFASELIGKEYTYPKVKRHATISKKAKTKITRVYTFHRRLPDGKVDEFAIAKFKTADGKTVSKSFSVTKYGRDKAIEMATMFRKVWLNFVAKKNGEIRFLSSIEYIKVNIVWYCNT